MVEIIKASTKHVDEITKLAVGFWDESDFNNGLLHIRTDRFKDVLLTHIERRDTCALCAIDDGKIVGYVLIYYQTDYTEEPVGEMFQFYVSPEYRGTEVPRLLVGGAITQYEDWGCVRAYCEASSGITSASYLKKFSNLWKKFGYEETGVTLKREF